MGGACAEIVAFGDYDHIGIKVDWKRASERLDRLGYTDNGRALWRHTGSLLRPYLGLISSLALRLERERVLDGPDIDAMVFRG
jgi:hypothetical protein